MLDLAIAEFGFHSLRYSYFSQLSDGFEVDVVRRAESDMAPAQLNENVSFGAEVKKSQDLFSILKKKTFCFLVWGFIVKTGKPSN